VRSTIDKRLQLRYPPFSNPIFFLATSVAKKLDHYNVGWLEKHKVEVVCLNGDFSVQGVRQFLLAKQTVV